MNLTLDEALYKVFHTPQLYSRVKLLSKYVLKRKFAADKTSLSDSLKRKIIELAGGLRVQEEQFTFVDSPENLAKKKQLEKPKGRWA